MERAHLTDKEVAFEFGISIHTLRAGRYRANLNVPPHVRIGGRVRDTRAAVTTWAKANGIDLTAPRQRREIVPTKVRI